MTKKNGAMIKKRNDKPLVIESEIVNEASTSEDDFFEDVVKEPTHLPAVIAENLPVSRSSKAQDPLSLYVREISRYQLLTPDQEKELVRQLLETGDIEIAKGLVTANLRLVVKIAMEYRFAYQNVMDLIQEGNIGLMKAVSKYDPTKGAKLSYYASWWIRSYILKFILDNFRLVKIGTTQEQKKLFYNLMKEKDRLLGLGITPSVKQISHNLGVAEKTVEEMDMRLSSSGQELSLDKPLDEAEGKRVLADILSDDSVDVDTNLAHEEGVAILKTHLNDFLGTLKTRDVEIFKKRLLSEVPESLQAIADEYGVSRERIRQIEERLLGQLRVYMSDFLG